jgi:hypothetical protein
MKTNFHFHLKWQVDWYKRWSHKQVHQSLWRR